ncbi:MAG: redoxin domain-containing protein [Planctomycetaceae bacterium]
MKLREKLFGIMLLVVAAATVWRILTPRDAVQVTATFADERPAPTFQLLDQNGRQSNLQSYLHRHRIVLVFFDARQGLDGDPLMRRIREFAQAIKRTGIKLIAVSTPLIPEFKSQAESFPFPVLHDTRSGYPDSSSVKWGTAILPSKGAVADIRSAMFVIEQTGLVEWDGDKPIPVDDPELFLTQLISGS